MSTTQPTYSFLEAQRKLLKRLEGGRRNLTNPKDYGQPVTEAVELCFAEAERALHEAVHEALQNIMNTYSQEAFGLIVDILDKEITPKEKQITPKH